MILPMNMVPILIILSAVVFVGIVTVMLRKTIKHDRAAIASDMDEPHEVETYKQIFKLNPIPIPMEMDQILYPSSGMVK